MRAVWLTTIGGIDWPHSYYAEPQKEELRQTLDQLRRAGINTVLLQTRVRATTIYPSALEPWDGCITGTPGRAAGYDPLRFCIDECHKRGMQLHAWVVTIPVGKWNTTGCQQLRKKYPKLIKKIKDEGYMDPEQAATGDYLARFCREIVENYDVDGIHLDYIRYPETWKIKGSRAQARANITRIVRTISREVKRIKPWVMLSCSPIGKHDDLSRYRSGGWNARTAVCQDAQQWLREGLMDALFPMMYFRDNQFFPFAIDWQERSYGRIVCPGLGIYFLDPREGRWTLDVIDRQLNVLRQIGLGHCYFRSKFFTDNTKGVYDLGQRFDATPALIPPMTWASPTPPPAPQELTFEKGTLSWKASQPTPLLYIYNVYGSPDFPVDITKAENLLATRVQDTRLRMPAGTRLNYAVTIQDRYGQEGPAAQLLLYAGPKYVRPKLTCVRGNSVALPPKPSTLDADYVIIEDLTGREVGYRYYRDSLIDVSTLPGGIYQLRSIGRKGRNHRLGFFSIKRK